MKKVVVYCHGYKSSSKAEKVRILREAGFEVIVCDIETDPTIGIKTLTDFVDDFLIDNYAREDFELVFVGTSLGGWYAAKVAGLYGAQAICVNPAYDPRELIMKINPSCEFACLFDPAIFDDNDTVVIAEDDEIIDFSVVEFPFAKEVIRVPTGGHRFVGKEFELVFDLINKV